MVKITIEIIKTTPRGGANTIHVDEFIRLQTAAFHRTNDRQGILHPTADIGEDMKAFLKDRPAITLVDASKLPSKRDDSKATTIQGGSLQTFTVQTEPAEKSISPQLVVQDLHSRGIHHIMVEGGAATALSFLRAGVVDRAIIVKASVQFQEPLDSNINESVLEQDGGLNMLGTSNDQGDIFGGDCVVYWVRGDEKEKWPADELTEWP